jgi:hypothetical protein
MDFDDWRTLHDTVVKEKADLEITKHEKAQWFWNSLCKKLAELRVDMEVILAALGGWCMNFPSANTTVTNFLEWFLDGGPGSTHRLFWVQWEYDLFHSDWCHQDAYRGGVWAFVGA